MNTIILEQAAIDALIYEGEEFHNNMKKYLQENNDSLEKSILEVISPYYNNVEQIFEGLILEADDEKKSGAIKKALGSAFDKVQKYTGIKKLRKAIGAALIKRGQKKYHEKAQVFKRKFRKAEREDGRNVTNLSSTPGPNPDPRVRHKKHAIEATVRYHMRPNKHTRGEVENLKNLYSGRGSGFKHFRKKYGGKDVQKAKKMIRLGKKIKGK